ncbi:MAG TPA: PAS domain S-box protein [Armatimonadota bacterium]|nr:PAS domain S-box protein [Armatimonadota bacterium]
MTRPLRVLLVEDSPATAAQILDIVRHGGFAVTASRVDTTARFREELGRQNWDVVVTAYTLAHCDVFSLLAILRELELAIPLLVVTDTIGDEAVADVMRAGANDVVSLTNLSRLAPAVARIVEQANERRERQLALEEERYRCGESERHHALLQTIIHEAPLGIAIVEGPEHRILLINPAFGPFVKGKGTVSGCTMAEAFPEIAARIVPILDQVYQTGEPYRITEMPITLLKNERFEDVYFDANYTAWRDEQGNIQGVLIVANETTDQVNTRKQVEAERLRLQTVLQTLPVGVLILDEEHHLIATNSMAEHIYGGKAQLSESIQEFRRGRSWWGKSEEPVHEEEWPSYRALNEGVTVFDQEITIERADRQKAIILDSAAPLRDVNGHIDGAVVIIQDITERKQTEARARESEERFRMVLENSLDAAYRRNLQTDQYDYMSPVIERITGFSAEEFSNLDFADVLSRMHHDDIERVNRVIERTMAAGVNTEGIVEYRFRGKDGRYRWLADRFTMIFDQNGHPLYRIGNVRDVTERKQAEDALRRERDRAQAYLDVAAVLMVAIDRNGIVTMINQRGLTILGYTRDEILGHSWYDLILPPDKKVEVENIVRRLIAGDIAPVEYHENEVVTKSGERRTIAFHNAVLRDENGHITALLASGEDITERREAEDAVRKSEEKFRSLFVNMSEAVAIDELIVDEQGKPIDWCVIDVNPAYETMLGFSRQETVNHYASELYKDISDFQNILMDYASVVLGGESRVVETDFPHTGRYLLVSAFSMGDKRFATASTDITERKEAEEKVNSLASIVEWSEDAIIGKTLDGIVTSWNHAAERMYGYAADEIIGRSLQIIFPPDLAGELREILDKIKQGQRLQRYETVRLRKDGTRVNVAVTISPIRDAHGKIVGASTSAQDITARKQAEEARAQALAELDATIGAIPDGYIVYGLDGTVRRMNDTAERVLGYSKDERQLSYNERMRLMAIESPDGKPFSINELPSYRALRGETVRGVVMVIHRRQQTRWLSVSAAPIHTADGQMLGAVMEFTDVTALHQLQEQQQDMLRTISHDLRAPLTIINGHAQLLDEALKDHPHTDTERMSVDAVLRGTQRMNVMIQDMVDAARMEGGQLRLNIQAVDVQSFIDDLLQRANAIMDTARISTEFPTNLPKVWADYDRLERIMMNLLTNALKYSDPGTPVEIRAQSQGQDVVISVIDHGQGILPEDVPHIFERYYRAKNTRKTEGVGLGLYITRMLVEAHGGRIWVESSPGKGSTFFFTLHIAENAAA